MNKYNFLSRNGFVIAAFTAITFTACTVHDTNEEPKMEGETVASNETTTTASGDMLRNVDSTGMMAGNNTASEVATANAVAPDANSMDANTSMAKPNAAKKGMKGKVMIMPAPKLTGAMEKDAQGVYSNVEYLPSFPGGNSGLQKYFDNNLQYPQMATDDGVEGTVNVQFIVDENGKLSSPMVKGGKLGYGLDEAAMAAISKMPAWNPGKLKGQNVKTRFTIPVTFQLY